MIIRKERYKKPISEIVDILISHGYDVSDTINTLQSILHEIRRYPLAEKVANHAQNLRDVC